MAIGTTLIITAIATAVMSGVATTYYKTNGWGAGNKVKSGLDIKKEQEAKKAAETVGQIQRGGRTFSKVRNNYATQSIRPTQPTQPTQLTQPLQPTLGTLPTLPTGYRWQEIQNQTQAQKDSELFVDRYDSKANRGILSTGVNLITDAINKIETPKNFIETISLPLRFLYDLSYSTVDNYIWDLNGDKDSMLKNIFVDPWIEVSEGKSNWGQALLGSAANTLNSITEVFDILANPIKGIANQGFQGFLNGLGLGGQGYVVYDWDTGNFGTDLLAEILSDPLNFAMIAKVPLGIAKKGISTGAKAIAKEVTTEGLEAASKEGLQSVLKQSSEEMLTNATTRLATNSAKLSKEAGVELTEAASKKINKFLANQLIQNGFTDVNEEVLGGFYKQALKTLTTKTGTNKITAYTLRKLDLNSILPDLTKALKKVAKETKDISLKKAYKAIAKYGIIDNSSKPISTVYLQRFQDIVIDSTESVLTDANQRLALGMSQDLSKVQDEILARASQTLAKANIPVTPDNLELLKKAVSEFVRDLDLNSMTAKVLTSMNPAGKKLYMKLDKSIKWLSKIDDDLNIFQKGLNKIAWYGTAAPLPILGKALKNTPYGRLVSNRPGEWLKALFAKITNRAAVKFNKAIAEMSQEFTPESYAAMRKIFMDNTAVASEKLALDLEEGLLNPEDFKSLTYTEAFQRSYISKFNQDLAYFDKILKEGGDDTTYISQHWEDYIRRNYKMSSTQYLKYLEEIDAVELSLTSSAVYRPFVNRIKTNNAVINANALENVLDTKPNPTFKQGRHLSKAEIQSLNTNIKVLTADEYNNTSFTLADRQAFIQSNNKAYIEQELYKKTSALREELEARITHYTDPITGEAISVTEKAGSVLDKLNNLNDTALNPLLDEITTALYNAEKTNKFFKLLGSPHILGAIDPKYQQEVYTSLIDSFMGLNNKVAGLNSADEITDVLASVAELQLKSRKIVQDMPTGYLTQNVDFMLNLRATVELYLSEIPTGKFVVNELQDMVGPLRLLSDRVEKMGLDPKVTDTISKLKDETNLIVNNIQDEIIVIPTELYRVNADVFNTSSIHEALMQAAKGNLAGTLIPIANGANIAKFFSGVRSTARFDVKVLDQVQKIADTASSIYNKIYLKEISTEATTLVEKAWKDILQGFEYAIEGNTTYCKELFAIFKSTQNLQVWEKYSLIKALYELTPSSLESALLQKTVKVIVNAADNADLYRSLKNFSKLTNNPVTLNSGFDIRRARNITYSGSTRRAIADLEDIAKEYSQIKRGAGSLEAQIKNVSNSESMLALHNHQVRALRQFYDDHVSKFQTNINKSINSLDMLKLEELAATFLDTDDLTTLKDIYRGVDDISPERLQRLERSIENYNSNLINTEDEFIKTKLDEDQFKDFINLMIRDDLNETELKHLFDVYGDIIAYKQYVPNTIKKLFADEYGYLNNIRIKLKKGGSPGATPLLGRTIELNYNYLRQYSQLRYVYQHETVHESLYRLSPTAHRRFINQTYESFLKTDPELVDYMYDVTWYTYFKYHGVDHRYFTSDVFTKNNIHIKEEVVANLLGKGEFPKDLSNQIVKYSTDLPTAKARELTRLHDPDLGSPQLLEKAKIAYKELIQSTAKSSPNQILEIPRLRAGKYFDLNKPFKEADKLIQEVKQSNNKRMQYMIRKRLKQNPLELAKDLARTGPFQFYSMSTIRSLQGDYGIYRYFDKDFNIRPKEYAELEAAGVHIVKYDDLDTLMFYIDKDKVAFDGASYYNRSRVDFVPERINWGGTMTEAGNSFNDTMYALTGQTIGYSNGFRADEKFYNTLFKGVRDGFESDFPSWTGIDFLNKKLGGWELEDLTKGNYYNTYRFNEMVMGNNSYMRRFGIYQSSNPYVNMSNALQQAQMMSKTQTELLTTFFDNTFSTGREGIWGQYPAEQLFKAYQDHPEMVLITLRGKANGIGYRIQEFIPYSFTDIQKAKKMGARFVPRSWYNLMHNVLNNRIGSKGLLKWFSKYNFIYKFFTLATNLMTFIRNAFDTYGKNVIELGDEMPYWTSYAWQIQDSYQNVNNALRQLGKFSEKDIEEFFTSGMSKAYAKANDFTYEMYKDLKHYEAWGPSTSGLADLVNNAKIDPNNPRILRTNGALSDSTLAVLEPTDDELMRMIARDTVPGYKGLWENATDMSSQYFDFMNNTVGLKAEKTNRLALYLKATAEGKTREQAFQWIRDVHFDYSTRTTFEQALELIFPFITFTMKNAEYWMRAIETTPWIQRYLADYLQTQMNYYDFDNNERAASEQWQYLIKSGNIPLWKTEDNIQAYFKLNPSFMDAFNTFINPIEVLKDRMLLPTRAIEKATTTDYKGQNLMGKQPIWNQVLDWTASIPGNALARRVTNAVKQPDTFSALTNDAIGKIKIYKPYTPKQYSTKFVYNKDFTSRQLQTKVYNNSYNNYKQGQYQRVRSEIAKQKRLNRLGMGYSITEPYNTTLRNVQGTTYFKMKLPTTQLPMPKADSNYLRLAKYRVQRGYFNR